MFVKIYFLLLFIICDDIIILLLNNDMSVIKWVLPGCQTASAKGKLSRFQSLACLGITGALCTTPSNAVEAHIFHPTLKFVVHIEARSDAHRLCSL
jgi:hypothetical protein